MAADRLDPPPRPYAEAAEAWVAERLGEELWSKQREIIDSVVANRYTAVKSCHASGKSHLASRIAAWWLDQHEPGEAFVVSTAPSWDQVRTVLWRYIGQAHAKGALAGRVNQTEWWVTDDMAHRKAPGPGEQQVAYGRKPNDYTPEGFQGIHARYVLVIIDEAGGVPKSLWDAVDTLVTNPDCRVLAIGNPDYPDSQFAEVCKPGSGWHTITVSAFDTPNFTDERDRVSPDILELLVGPEWVEERKHRWGEGSPLYVAKVLGEFPETAEDTALPLSYVRRAQAERVYGPDDLDGVELGVDVGAGGDKTVIRARRGIKAAEVWRYLTPDPMEAVGKVLLAIRETKATRVKVDATGLGWGVAGRLRELRTEGKHNAEIVPVYVAQAPHRPKNYPNLRSELWGDARERCGSIDGRRGPTWDLSELDDDTVADLISVRYTTNSQGQFVVEPKDETIARLGRSPDDADALLLAFYSPKGQYRPAGKAKDRRKKSRR